MPDLAISGLSSGDPTSASLIPVVNNSTTMQTTLDEAVGFVTTAAGDMMYAAAARNMARLAPPASGAVLTYSSAGSAPAWSIPTGSSHVLVGGTSAAAAQPAWRTDHIGTALAIASSINLGTTGTTVIPWNIENYDTDGMHSTSVNSSIITIQTPGVYSICANAVFGTSSPAGGSSSLVGLYILANSTAIAGAILPATVPGQIVNVASQWPMSSGQVIGVGAFVASTNSLSVGAQVQVQLIART